VTRSWDQQRFEFDTYGFAVLESVLDEKTSTRLAEKIDLLDVQRGIDYTHDGAFARHIASVYADDDELMALIDHPEVLGFIESILGSQIILGSSNARIVRPGDPLQPFHSDIPSQLRRSGPPVMLNAVWMIDEFNEANGATRFVPGSHLLAAATPPPDVAVPYEISALGPVGSVLVFNGQCWHGGGANRSDGIRRAIFAHYRISPWMRFALDPSRWVSPEQWERMTTRQRELLRMPDSLDQPTSADYY
jgi:ectoine hydroxylase-related dioxygenase (phytanoyl-CoA dioxygenase family)